VSGGDHCWFKRSTGEKMTVTDIYISYNNNNNNNNLSHWNSNEKLKENLEAVPGKHSIDSVQKTAVLGTSHTIRKVLQCEA
jgi:hypothetical protein